MSRMLEALKRIEAGSAQPRPQPEPAPAEEAHAGALPPSEAAPPAEPAVCPSPRPETPSAAQPVVCIPLETEAATLEQPTACMPVLPEVALQAAVVSQPLEAIYGDAVVQAALQQVEIACAAVAAASAPADDVSRDEIAANDVDVVARRTVADDVGAGDIATDHIAPHDLAADDIAAEAPAEELFPPAEAPATVDVRLVNHVLSQVSSGTAAVLLFTSPEDGTGTADVLSALAAALAERIDGELLLVDGNLHSPELSGRWGIASAKGLADVLLEAADWRDVIQATTTPRVSVLPGVKMPDEGHPTKRSNLRALWQDLRRCYRLVLVDAASLAHEEAAWLARDCAGTYLVVRLKHTSRRALAESVEVLSQGHGRLLGCVVIEALARHPAA